MYKAQTTWLPLELAGTVNKLIADFFLIKAFNADDEEVNLQTFCVTKAIDFIYE